MPVCESNFAVKASWLTLCVDFVYVVSEAERLMNGGFWG